MSYHHDFIFDKYNNLVCSSECKYCKIVSKYGSYQSKELVNYPIITNVGPHKQIDGQVLINTKLVKYVLLRTLAHCCIRHIDISNTSTKYICDIPSLEVLIANNCNLTKLPNYLPNLTKLQIDNNKINQVSFYPKLKHLSCVDNAITNVNHLTGLTYLKCSENPITEIKLFYLTYLEAYECPILVSYPIPTLVKRSSIFINGMVERIYVSKEKMNKNNIIINWKTSTHLVPLNQTSTLVKKVFPYLFKNGN